jgi:PAS domain S-box-containing protein
MGALHSYLCLLRPATGMARSVPGTGRQGSSGSAVPPPATACHRESRMELFREMTNGLPLIVWVHDADGQQEMVNDTFCEFFAVTREEMKGGRWQLLIHPDDTDAYLSEFLACVQQRRPFHAEVRVRRGDGQWRWLESWARPRWSAAGEFRGMVGSSADITDRKHADAALTEANRQIAGQHALVQAVFAVINDGLVVFDMDGQVVLSNDAAAVLLGHARGADVMRSLTEFADQYVLETLDGHTVEVAQWPAARALRGERFSHCELRLRRHGSDAEWIIAFSGEPIPDDEGRQNWAMVIMQDVTERWRKDRALLDSAERLRENDRRKDAYLAMLGHELRNPLAAIKSATDLIGRAHSHDPIIARAAEVLDRQSTHMTRLIEGLLEVSRIATGKITLERSALDLREILRAVLDDRADEIAASGLQTTIELPDAPAWVVGDRVRLVQVFDNLVGNALKFTPAPGRITLQLTASDSELLTRVVDTGVGLPPGSLTDIFEPFHQVDQGIARGQGGLGLGLSLVQQLVQMHQGRITASSQGPGHGSEFTVSLPRGTAPPAQADADRPGSTIDRRRVLIVEDNRDAAEMLCFLLEFNGHQAEITSTGEQALRRLRHGDKDLVICDIGLPGMDGYALARSIRADPQLRALTLIALTGYGQADDRRRVQAAGFDAHLVKPVDQQALQEALRLSTERLPAGEAVSE